MYLESSLQAGNITTVPSYDFHALPCELLRSIARSISGDGPTLYSGFFRRPRPQSLLGPLLLRSRLQVCHDVSDLLSFFVLEMEERPSKDLFELCRDSFSFIQHLYIPLIFSDPAQYSNFEVSGDGFGKVSAAI